MDINVKVGKPFNQTVHYTAGVGVKTKKEQKINHDLYIEQRGFKIEIKYLKNWVSSSDTCGTYQQVKDGENFNKILIGLWMKLIQIIMEK